MAIVDDTMWTIIEFKEHSQTNVRLKGYIIKKQYKAMYIIGYTSRIKECYEK